LREELDTGAGGRGLSDSRRDPSRLRNSMPSISSICPLAPAAPGSGSEFAARDDDGAGRALVDLDADQLVYVVVRHLMGVVVLALHNDALVAALEAKVYAPIEGRSGATVPQCSTA
jgi:hypothetical protein